MEMYAFGSAASTNKKKIKKIKKRKYSDLPNYFYKAVRAATIKRSYSSISLALSL